MDSLEIGLVKESEVEAKVDYTLNSVTNLPLVESAAIVEISEVI